MENIVTLAKKVSEAFETRTRDNGERFTALKAGSPEWMTDLCREAHGDMMPDDWRYETIYETVERIADCDEDSDRDSIFDEVQSELEADVYNMDRCKWLASHLDRAGYVDDAVNCYGHSKEHSIFEEIGWGQVAEKEEILVQVLNFLERFAKDKEATEEDQ